MTEPKRYFATGVKEYRPRDSIVFTGTPTDLFIRASDFDAFKQEHERIVADLKGAHLVLHDARVRHLSDEENPHPIGLSARISLLLCEHERIVAEKDAEIIASEQRYLSAVEGRMQFRQSFKELRKTLAHIELSMDGKDFAVTPLEVRIEELRQERDRLRAEIASLKDQLKTCRDKALKEKISDSLRRQGVTEITDGTSAFDDAMTPNKETP